MHGLRISDFPDPDAAGGSPSNGRTFIGDHVVAASLPRLTFWMGIRAAGGMVTLVVDVTEHNAQDMVRHGRKFPQRQMRLVERYTLTGDTIRYEVASPSQGLHAAWKVSMPICRQTDQDRLLECACNAEVEANGAFAGSAHLVSQALRLVSRLSRTLMGMITRRGSISRLHLVQGFAAAMMVCLHPAPVPRRAPMHSQIGDSGRCALLMMEARLRATHAR